MEKYYCHLRNNFQELNLVKSVDPLVWSLLFWFCLGWTLYMCYNHQLISFDTNSSGSLLCQQMFPHNIAHISFIIGTHSMQTSSIFWWNIPFCHTKLYWWGQINSAWKVQFHEIRCIHVLLQWTCVLLTLAKFTLINQ